MTSGVGIGVVLAGGRATRMDGDKAGAVLAGRTLLERAVEIVRAAGLEPRVCARASTVLPRVAGLDPGAIWREPWPADGADAAHPLAGLAHAAATAGEPIVAIPVDLPLLPPDAVRRLAEVASGSAILGTGGSPAALVARIDPSLANALADAAARGAPTLRTLLQLGARVVELSECAPSADLARAFTNVNGPDDLEAVERLLGGD